MPMALRNYLVSSCVCKYQYLKLCVMNPHRTDGFRVVYINASVAWQSLQQTAGVCVRAVHHYAYTYYNFFAEAAVCYVMLDYSEID